MARYVVANWKSYKTMAEVEKWLETFTNLYRPDPLVEVIIAPSFVHLAPLWGLLQEHNPSRLTLAVQDLSSFPLGAYTGAVAAEMVRDMVGYAIVGHAERRRYFHETNQDIANKVSEAAAARIRPILCVDRPNIRFIERGQLRMGIGSVNTEYRFDPCRRCLTHFVGDVLVGFMKIASPFRMADNGITNHVSHHFRGHRPGISP